MFKFLRIVLGGSLSAALLVGCSSAPSMEQNAPIPHDADTICAISHPCPAVPRPTAEETQLCKAIFSDTQAECRTENIDLFVCSMRAARCDETGDIDDEATMTSLMANCDASRLKLERCCATATAGNAVHCGLFRDDSEAPYEDDDAGASDEDAE